MRKRKSIGTGIGIASIVGLVLAAASPAAVASATTVRPADAAGVFTLCSNGFTSYAQFPDRGGFSTVLVNSGSCVSFDIGGDENEQVNIYEYDGGNGVTSASDYLGSTIYNGLSGLTIVTEPGPTFFVD